MSHRIAYEPSMNVKVKTKGRDRQSAITPF